MPIARALPRMLAAVSFVSAAGSAIASDWRYSVGVHEFSVPDVNSHTYGINGSVSIDTVTESGRHVFGSFDVFLDHDKDHLDSDHIPLWWQLHLGSDGNFWRADRLRLGWTADVETRINTVSSIERQISALPALVAGYDGQVVQATLEAGAGWFFLEIDDDAPRERGYDRSTLRNSTFAYAATARIALRLGEAWTLSGRARGWRDSQGMLETQYQAALRMDASSWWSAASLTRPALVLSADYYRYNLDPYNRSGMPPILRWNDDLTIRLALEADW